MSGQLVLSSHVSKVSLKFIYLGLKLWRRGLLSRVATLPVSKKGKTKRTDRVGEREKVIHWLEDAQTRIGASTPATCTYYIMPHLLLWSHHRHRLYSWLLCHSSFLIFNLRWLYLSPAVTTFTPDEFLSRRHYIYIGCIQILQINW